MNVTVRTSLEKLAYIERYVAALRGKPHTVRLIESELRSPIKRKIYAAVGGLKPGEEEAIDVLGDGREVAIDREGNVRRD